MRPKRPNSPSVLRFRDKRSPIVAPAPVPSVRDATPGKTSRNTDNKVISSPQGGKFSLTHTTPLHRNKTIH